MLFRSHDGPSVLRVINFYHNINDRSSLDVLLTLDLNSTVLMLLCRDFNLHSPSWLPVGFSQFTCSDAFKMWAARQTFSLQTPPDMVTHCGVEQEWPSMLDLMWHNLLADGCADLSPPMYDWEVSVSSDHCRVSTGPPKGELAPPLQMFDPDMDNKASALWDVCLDVSLPLLWMVDTLCHKHAPRAHAHAWWTPTCSCTSGPRCQCQ